MTFDPPFCERPSLHHSFMPKRQCLAKRLCSCPIDAHQLHCIVCKTGCGVDQRHFALARCMADLVTGAKVYAKQTIPGLPREPHHVESTTTTCASRYPVPHVCPHSSFWSAPPLPGGQVWGGPPNVKTTGGRGGRLQAGWSQGRDPKSFFLCPLLGVSVFSGRLLGCFRGAAETLEEQGPPPTSLFCLRVTTSHRSTGHWQEIPREAAAVSSAARLRTCHSQSNGSPEPTVCHLYFSTCTKRRWA